MTKTFFISKSAFIKGLQCLKALYFYKNNYKDRDIPSAELLKRFQIGIDFGLLALNFFPNGYDCTPKNKFPSSIAASAKDVAKILHNLDNVTLYEASFLANPLLSILDILVKKNNLLLAYEVKSSVIVSSTYIYDAAFQYYVMTLAGFQPDKFFIVHLKNTSLDINNISFDEIAFTEITKQVIDLQDFIKNKVEKMITMLQTNICPNIEQGNHCTIPYQCDFYTICNKLLKDNASTNS